MRLFRSFIIALSMYSKIPVPTLSWEKRDMEYIFCFFPVIGAVAGALTLLWIKIAVFFEISTVLTAAVCVLLPVLVTGGIHIDGFCDTSDALASGRDREKMLEILKDPNVGAFAVIRCICYFLLLFALWYQALTDEINIFIPSLIYILSRALSGMAAVTRKNARGSGMLAAFSDSAARGVVISVTVLWLLLCAVLLLLAEIQAGLVVLSAAGLTYLYYYLMSERKFGGITGDLAGWFLCVCELVCLLATVVIGRIF